MDRGPEPPDVDAGAAHHRLDRPRRGRRTGSARRPPAAARSASRIECQTPSMCTCGAGDPDQVAVRPGRARPRRPAPAPPPCRVWPPRCAAAWLWKICCRSSATPAGAAAWAPRPGWPPRTGRAARSARAAAAGRPAPWRAGGPGRRPARSGSSSPAWRPPTGRGRRLRADRDVRGPGQQQLRRTGRDCGRSARRPGRRPGRRTVRAGRARRARRTGWTRPPAAAGGRGRPR